MYAAQVEQQQHFPSWIEARVVIVSNIVFAQEAIYVRIHDEYIYIKQQSTQSQVMRHSIFQTLVFAQMTLPSKPDTDRRFPPCLLASHAQLRFEGIPQRRGEVLPVCVYTGSAGCQTWWEWMVDISNRLHPANTITGTKRRPPPLALASDAHVISHQLTVDPIYPTWLRQTLCVQSVYSPPVQFTARDALLGPDLGLQWLGNSQSAAERS